MILIALGILKACYMDACVSRALWFPGKHYNYTSTTMQESCAGAVEKNRVFFVCFLLTVFTISVHFMCQTVICPVRQEEKAQRQTQWSPLKLCLHLPSDPECFTKHVSCLIA